MKPYFILILLLTTNLVWSQNQTRQPDFTQVLTPNELDSGEWTTRISAIDTLEHYVVQLVTTQEKDAYATNWVCLQIFEKQSGDFIQEIDLRDYNSHDNGADRFDNGDFNFDGYEDFSLFEANYNMDNTSSRYFLFDPDTKTFFDSGFEGSNLEFDHEKKTITTHNRCCGGTQEYSAEYTLVDNEMVLLKEHCFKLKSNEEGEPILDEDGYMQIEEVNCNESLIDDEDSIGEVELVADILESNVEDAIEQDQTIILDFPTLAEEGVQISTSSDHQIRVFSWEDKIVDDIPYYRLRIQYKVTDSLSRHYTLPEYITYPEDSALYATRIDTITHLRSGIYLLQGHYLSPEGKQGERLFAFDIRTGILKKAFVFHDENTNACFMDNIVSLSINHFSLENEQLTIIPETAETSPIYTPITLYYNGAYFESLAEKEEREAKSTKGKYSIVRLYFKDAQNTRALDEVLPHAGISILTEIAHKANEITDIEGELTDLSLECSFYKGNPTINIRHLPIISGYVNIENLDIISLCKAQTSSKWKFWKRFGQQSIQEVAGQNEGLPYQKLRYTTVLFKRLPSKKTTNQVHWAVQPEGSAVELLNPEQFHGTHIELTLRPEWKGKTIKVIPYIGNQFIDGAFKSTVVTDL